MAHPDIALPDYARTMGIAVETPAGATPVLAMDYSPDLCGNPGMFHGGAVSTLLEMAAIAALDAQLRAGHGPARLTPLNTTVEFLRAAGEERAFASASVVKAGRRLATLSATLWQASPDKPVATAIVNVAIAPADQKEAP